MAIQGFYGLSNPVELNLFLLSEWLKFGPIRNDFSKWCFSARRFRSSESLKVRLFWFCTIRFFFKTPVSGPCTKWLGGAGSYPTNLFASLFIKDCVFPQSSFVVVLKKVIQFRFIEAFEKWAIVMTSLQETRFAQKRLYHVNNIFKIQRLCLKSWLVFFFTNLEQKNVLMASNIIE